MRNLHIVFWGLILLLVQVPAYAQTKMPQFHKALAGTMVRTTPFAIVYRLDSVDEYRLCNAYREERYIATIGVDNVQKVLKQSCELNVVAYTNLKKSLEFDTYVVQYKGKLYFLSPDNVADNTALTKQNILVEQYYNNLKQSIVDAQAKLDKERGVYLQICQDSLIYYKNKSSDIPRLKDSILGALKEQHRQILQAKQNELDVVYKSWYDKQPATTKYALGLINIESAVLCPPNSVGGCDYRFSYVNKSRKTIKYLYWEGTIYNAVNDVVYCDIRRCCNYTGKDTGPVACGATGGGVWDCIIYNHSADTVKLNNIKITYLDGSNATINASDIRRMVQAPSTDIPYELTSKLDRELFQKELELKKMPLEMHFSSMVARWEERVRHLEGVQEMYWLPVVPIEEYRPDNYNPIYLKLHELNKEIKGLQTVVTRFERANFVGQGD